MAFFVKTKNKEKESEKSDCNITVLLYTLAKRIGLTLQELNEMSTQTLVDIISAYAGEDDSKPKEATQADIDSFFG